MASYWTDPAQFELDIQQNLVRYYDACVNRRKLFDMLRKKVWLHVYLSSLHKAPCGVYLPAYGFDLATLVVCDAMRPFLPSLLNPLSAT